ncbi:Hypothetical protein R9X50_00223300 [Acrodontium crateriforme]|uniref:Oxidoreductase n=1 Tax=Acrodontium crateriforme TaxID=150365 RepID=A0AAQ3M235_9PEZI|nr:Hypothetical protein R9X50_00223300 [Acrodontium crateriforme]
MSPFSFNPDRDIPSLNGKVIFITGGTAGLGLGSIVTLAKHNPAHIVFSGRNQKSADGLIERVKKSSPNVPLTFVKCDISSFASVQEAAKSLTSQCDRLDIVMLNAGIMAVDPATSTDGYEIQFATNHLGHALLVKLLLPLLQKTAQTPDGDVRIINMTSIAYKQAPKMGIDFATLKSPQASLGGLIPGGKWSRYGQSKLAQLLYSQELAKHYPEITSVSVHPGIILTGLFENVDMVTKLPVLLMSIGGRTPVDEGHWNQCWAATVEKSKLKNGEYYEPIGKIGSRKTTQARDETLADELWNWTQRQLEAFCAEKV